MGKLLAAPTVLAAVGCFLIALGTSTRVWVATSQPAVYNAQNATLDHFGLWQACVVSTPQGDTSCAGVNYWCDMQVCGWINFWNAVCVTYPIWALDNCAAYQATRAFAIMALSFTFFGAISLGAASGFLDSMRFGRSGGLITSIGGIFGMMAMAIFVGSIYNGTGTNGQDINSVFKLDWSFGVFTAGWALCFIAGLLGLGIASRLEKQVNVATEMS
eukprot:comp12625_c0_seq1/m.7667 comp12625_c0_seq1/g.7667  ORF comp12625_c0_seq1/g.7667 comp12625_c0_seq1/m.7667 type:complete len:216 (-) comp12625_c0_seq1:519-1166(-)